MRNYTNRKNSNNNTFPRCCVLNRTCRTCNVGRKVYQVHQGHKPCISFHSCRHWLSMHTCGISNLYGYDVGLVSCNNDMCILKNGIWVELRAVNRRGGNLRGSWKMIILFMKILIINRPRFVFLNLQIALGNIAYGFNPIFALLFLW